MPKCEVHSRIDAAGYCHGCGVFGCEACLPATDEQGKRYCRRCAELSGVPAPRAPRGEEHIRHRYVVRYKDGRRLRGTFYAIDLDSDGFNFIAISMRGDRREKQVYVRFKDLKAIFQVEDFRGNRHHPPRYLSPDYSDREEVAAYFADGEVIRGRTSGHYTTHDKRFYLVPRDKNDNNLLIIVETSAVDRVGTHGAQCVREMHDLVTNAVRKRLLTYYWRHRGSVATVPEIARRIDRTESAVSQNIAPYVEHGLMERRIEDGTEVLTLNDPRDHATREFLRANYEEISRFYFRRDRGPASEANTALR